MPFCTTCGSQVADVDVYCANCGSRQAETAAAAGTSGNSFLNNVSPRTAAMACYIPFVGWIPAIVVLAADRFQRNRTVRFHAFQGLYLLVAWLLVDWVIDPFLHALPGPGSMMFVGMALRLAIFGAWIFMIIKTSQEQFFRLPLLGELAERSVAEQR
jgi:uncharacterized membrane protein